MERGGADSGAERIDKFAVVMDDEIVGGFGSSVFSFMVGLIIL